MHIFGYRVPDNILTYLKPKISIVEAVFWNWIIMWIRIQISVVLYIWIRISQCICLIKRILDTVFEKPSASTAFRVVKF